MSNVSIDRNNTAATKCVSPATAAAASQDYRTAARVNLRRLADLPSLGVYWISNLAMTHRSTQRNRPTAARRTNVRGVRVRGGFTLIEAAIVTAIVGIGIVGLLELLAAGSMANINSKQLTTAVFLANNVNEMMQGHDYATLKGAFDNKTYAPPKDGRGVDLAGFAGWKQVVDVSYVLPNRLTTIVPDTQVEPTSRVTVKVVAGGEVIYQTQWIVAAPE